MRANPFETPFEIVAPRTARSQQLRFAGAAHRVVAVMARSVTARIWVLGRGMSADICRV
jgi:hypothetical protein